MTVIPGVRPWEELVGVVINVRTYLVKSSQVVGLRTRTASFPTLMFSSPGVVGYDGVVSNNQVDKLTYQF